MKELASGVQFLSRVNALPRSPDEHPDEWIPTRESLLSRIRHWDDQESWRDFFNTYWKLLYRAATKAGLSDAEAQEVVQETVMVVAKKMEHFKYDPAKDSFKGWLLYLTRKQVAMQYRKRQREGGGNGRRTGAASFTADLESIPDPAASALERLWEEEWERNLMDAAIANVKGILNPKQFQIFNFYVLKQWPVQEVAKTLEVSAARVYLAKHRISALVKKEIKKLEKQMV